MCNVLCWIWLIDWVGGFTLQSTNKIGHFENVLCTSIRLHWFSTVRNACWLVCPVTRTTYRSTFPQSRPVLLLLVFSSRKALVLCWCGRVRVTANQIRWFRLLTANDQSWSPTRHSSTSLHCCHTKHNTRDGRINDWRPDTRIRRRRSLPDWSVTGGRTWLA